MGVFGCDNSCWGWTKMAMPLPRQEFRQASHPCLLVCLALQLLGLCWCREQWHSKYCSPVFTKKILSLSFTSTLFIKYAKYLSYYRPCIYTLYIIAQYKTHPMQTGKYSGLVIICVCVCVYMSLFPPSSPAIVYFLHLLLCTEISDAADRDKTAD